MIRKDLKQFTADRRAMIISFAVPIALASFMAMLFGSAGSASPPSKIPLLVVDQDGSDLTKQAIEKLRQSPSVAVKIATRPEAETAIRSGKSVIGIVYPKGFGEAVRTSFGGGKPPNVQTLVDPAHTLEAQVVRGAVMQATAKAIAGDQSQLPFGMTTVTETAGNSQDWSGAGHAFAGMAMQGLLFWAVESAMIVMRERKMGIWNRLRAAPVPGELLLFGRLLSAALRSLMVVIVVLGFGMLAFGIRVHGSWLGLAIVAAAASLMAAAFGLFVAALGRTEAQSRGMTILAVLAMMMLGGAWYPSFLMPQWVQTISVVIPIRYAVDGFDAMTWRGSGLDAALANSGVMLLFVAALFAIALRRFRFEAE